MNKLSCAMLISFLLLAGCGGSSSTPTPILTDQEILYNLEFTSTWGATDFPTNYPSGSAHFSPLIGLTHNDQIHMFENSMLSTAGMVQVAETGSRSAIIPELDKYIADGYGFLKIEGDGIATGENTTTVSFKANQSHPLLSIASMIAPSPDWFVGLDSVILFDDNEWKDNLTFELKVYDAGSDDGVAFKSGNVESNPAQVIMLLDSARVDTDFTQGIHFDTSKTIATFKITIAK